MQYEWVLALLITVVIIIFLRKAHDILLDDRVEIEAFDGTKYKVRNTSNKKETADTLARINSKVLELFENIKNDLEKGEDQEYKPMIMRLISRYDPRTLSEGRIDKRFTSYTVNKGEQVVLCLRTRDSKDSIYDDNLIFYVTLHELAHIASVTENHSEEFHTNFRYLLRKASQYGMFQKVTHRFNYCGMDVNGM